MCARKQSSGCQPAKVAPQAYPDGARTLPAMPQSSSWSGAGEAADGPASLRRAEAQTGDGDAGGCASAGLCPREARQGPAAQSYATRETGFQAMLLSRRPYCSLTLEGSASAGRRPRHSRRAGAAPAAAHRP